jgi:UDP-N-acetylmuramate: L-alanyl-gamma-D-glutamyl-meso-diaminopimelate ligase
VLSRRALDVYCIAIGGTGMAPLACLLQEQGHRVRGSDGPLYPPMSDLLSAHGIRPLTGFAAEHLEPAPDLVVVGNAVPRTNPEVVEAERRGLPRVSMPEALARFFLDRRQPLVVAGTHGKTTTTALAAWVYTACGRDPGYLVGGVPLGLPASFRVAGGERFVVEGDEYNAAYFDRGPKFLHYRPETVILTSVEHDHADLYPDPAGLTEAFGRLLDLLPASGLAVVCGDSPEVLRLAGRAPCPVVTYGLDPANRVAPAGPVETLAAGGGDATGAAGRGGSRFRIADPEAGEIEVTLPIAGRHNVANALAVWAVARRDGIPAAEVAAALAGFAGVKRRQEELGTAAGVTVVDDFAHHPTAVAATLEALAGRYPGRRLTAVFEPRSLSAGRRMFHDAYRAAFAGAGRVVLAPVFHAGRLADGERLDTAGLAAELAAAGVVAQASPTSGELLDRVLAGTRPGDVVVTMSSGSFDGLPHRLLAALGQRAAPPAVAGRG